MARGEDLSYQTFETYYARAQAAEEAGSCQEAKQLYLAAGQALLKAARRSSGRTRAAMMLRADKLIRLSERMELLPKTENGAALQSVDVSGRKNGGGDQTEESVTVWKKAERPKVAFDDIAGLAEVKKSIRRRLILPRQHPEIYEAFHREVSGGILLYGPPGTGKTMFARAIACEGDADFFPVRCSDIVGKYFGEAEKNVKSLFETAQQAKSAVIFLDEFEALGARRDGAATVMNRLVPELLSQMDGFGAAKRRHVMVLAATNRPWDIDSAFLRPPRLTEKIYVGLPDFEARLFLIERAFREVPCSEELAFSDLALQTEGYSAADLTCLCNTIKDGAIARSITEGKLSEITPEDVQNGRSRVTSSVQPEDLAQIRSWEQKTGRI